MCEILTLRISSVRTSIRNDRRAKAEFRSCGSLSDRSNDMIMKTFNLKENISSVMVSFVHRYLIKRKARMNDYCDKCVIDHKQFTNDIKEFFKIHFLDNLTIYFHTLDVKELGSHILQQVH